jgi:hypothetical protein
LVCTSTGEDKPTEIFAPETTNGISIENENKTKLEAKSIKTAAIK